MTEKGKNEIYESDKLLTMVMTVLQISLIGMIGLVLYSGYLALENSPILVGLMKDGLIQ